MVRCESPATLFYLLLSRWKVAPELIIYDNACNFHVYCMLREPLFFSETRILVDRFHWPNHKSCSMSFCMAAFSADPFLFGINSQKAEQLNSQLVVSNSLLGMSQVHFCLHLIHLIYRIYLRRLELRVEEDEKRKRRDAIKKRRADAAEDF
jgi:hypothetical protein